MLLKFGIPNWLDTVAKIVEFMYHNWISKLDIILASVMPSAGTNST